MLLQRYFPIGKRGGSGVAGSGLKVALSRSDIYKFNPTAGATATTVSVTATATLGTGPYTYLWNGGFRITANSPNSATTTCSATGRGIASDDLETMICTVTDSLGATAFNTVTVEIQIGGLAK